MTLFWKTAEFDSVLAKMSDFEKKMFENLWDEELRGCAEFFSDTDGFADEMYVTEMEIKMADHIFGSFYDMVMEKLDDDQSERFMEDVFMELGGSSDNFIW